MFIRHDVPLQSPPHFNTSTAPARPSPKPKNVDAPSPVAPAPVHVSIPKDLKARFDLALQAQTLPWAESEAVVCALWDEQCNFRDPLVRFNNRAEFIKYLKMMDDWGKVPRVDITEAHLEGNVGMAKGILYYALKKGPTMAAQFTTRMEFNDAGRIVDHEDKWNVLGTLINTLLGRRAPPTERNTP